MAEVKKIFCCLACGRDTTSPTELCVEHRIGSMGYFDRHTEQRDRKSLSPIKASRAAEGSTDF
jgi:hypothetical protein